MPNTVIAAFPLYYFVSEEAASQHICAECAEEAISERCAHFRMPSEPETAAEWDYMMRKEVSC
jgi:hypothetical protein